MLFLFKKPKQAPFLNQRKPGGLFKKNGFFSILVNTAC